MSKLHEKSPCCREKIIKYGRRRRQCIRCHRTWRVWAKRRGRKQRRSSSKTIGRYLSLRSSIGRINPGPKYSARLRNNLRIFNQKIAWPYIPTNKDLVLISDALLQTFEGSYWTVFCFLIRPTDSNKAIILPPVIRKGNEHSNGGWEPILANNPNSDVHKRVKVLVCDGQQSLVAYGKRRGWIVQRCHFHLKASILNYFHAGPNSKYRVLSLRIQELVNSIIHTADKDKNRVAIRELGRIQMMVRSRGIKKVLSGFLKHYPDFQSYLKYQEMNIPTTTNSMESFIGSFREFQRRTRGFKTVDSFKKWLEAFFKNKKQITCNGRSYQPN